MEIYVGNLHPELDENHLRILFEPFGVVIKAYIARDKETGESKGFGFVHLYHMLDAQQAIKDMNGRELAGRTLVVTEAKTKEKNFNKNDEVNGNLSTEIREQDEDNNGDFSDLMGKDNEEDLDLEVKNKLEFSKEILHNGFVKIKFKKD